MKDVKGILSFTLSLASTYKYTFIHTLRQMYLHFVCVICYSNANPLKCFLKVPLPGRIPDHKT